MTIFNPFIQKLLVSDNLEVYKLGLMLMKDPEVVFISQWLEADELKELDLRYFYAREDKMRIAEGYYIKSGIEGYGLRDDYTLRMDLPKDPFIYIKRYKNANDI